MIEHIETQFGVKDLWYLEVIAVHPLLQGRGLGKLALESLLKLTGPDPIVLECTNSSNVAFYERLGFEVVQEVVLGAGSYSEGDKCKLWVMLRTNSERAKDVE